jgi:hypothetical protein
LILAQAHNFVPQSEWTATLISCFEANSFWQPFVDKNIIDLSVTGPLSTNGEEKMTTPNTNALSKLSPEKLAVLSDELKASFCLLSEADQDFFANNFSPASLPGVISKKAELMKQNLAHAEQYKNLMAKIASDAPASNTASVGADNILTGMAAVLGIGAVSAVAVTDNTAFYEGLTPSELVTPLRNEFENQNTSFSTSGDDNTSIPATISLNGAGQYTPALTINMTRINDGAEIKVNDLTSTGVLETLKSGGEKIIDMAGKGLSLLNRQKQGNLSVEEAFSTAKQTLDTGTSLAEDASNLNLKARAWKVIRPLAESIESQARAEKAAALERQMVLEKAWDQYTACPTCGVAFSAEDTTCRVCGSARPQMPLNPDPRA